MNCPPSMENCIVLPDICKPAISKLAICKFGWQLMFLLCFADWNMSSSLVYAQLPTAELHTLSRSVVQLGSKFDLSLQGSRLEEADQLLISDLMGNPIDAQVSARMAPSAPLQDWRTTTGTFDVLLGPDTQAGMVEVRCRGRFGLGTPRRLLLTDVPVIQPATGHNHLNTALAVASEQLIHDRTLAQGSNFYRLTVQPGQVLRCVVYSQQLWSAANLRLRLRNGKGQLLVTSQSMGAWPAEIQWPHAGSEVQDYILEINDLLARGGAAFDYVMESRIDSLPAPDTNHPSLPKMYLDTLLRPSLDAIPNTAAWLSPSGAACLPANASDYTAIPAQPITQFPVRLRGSLPESSRIDFEAEAGQVLTFDVASAKLEQLTAHEQVIYKLPSDPASDATGLAPIVDQDDRPFLGTPAVRLRQIDPQLTWSAPETGRYRLQLLDNQSGVRPNDARGFLLEIRPANPSFSLIAHWAFPTNNVALSKPIGCQIQRLGTQQIHVTAVRHDGFSEPIELHVEGLPPGTLCANSRIPAGASEAVLNIQAAADATDGHSAIQVVGTARIADQDHHVSAVPATITAAASPVYNTITTARTGKLELAVQSLDLAPVQVQAGNAAVIEVKPNTKIQLPIQLLRQPGSAAECTLRPQSLPAKVTLGEVKVPGDQTQVSPELSVAGDAAPGEYTF
ncbi:MAG TPA: hypothetical protein DCF63_05230, partial [Planctomycetaceae bacterium]|nr:hypothetical protein [Planctomycetaceae bacterium]